jgi:dsRNA-specific ribonuclease
MESILGALYFSGNCTLDGAEKFYDNVFKPFFDEFVTFEMLVRHAVDAVLEMLKRLGCRQYSSVHDVQNGVHVCKSKASPLRSYRIRSNVLVVWHGSTLCEAKDPNFDVAMRRTSERCLQVLTEKPKLLRDSCNCQATQPAEGNKSDHRRR